MDVGRIRPPEMENMHSTAAANETGTQVPSMLRIRRMSVLIPVYNSEQTVGPLVDAVVEELRPRYDQLELVLVNDGSVDGSDSVIRQAVERHPSILRYIRLARNFGEHSAVMCGLHHVTGDCVAIIDDDFQNPPDQIGLLVDRLCEGFDVVYSYYEKKQHHWFRNLGSLFNDWIATRLLAKPPGLYLSSFKVLNRLLIDAVIRYDGPYPYLDGLILQSTTSIGQQLCQHAHRKAGRSNYTLRRLVRLWLNMFTGFSVLPLRLASLLGLAMSAAGFALAVFFLVSWSFGGVFFSHEKFPPGWASLIVTVTIFAGLQLCVLGMIGEYLGRVFQTMNRAPQFVVRETHGVHDGNIPLREES